MQKLHSTVWFLWLGGVLTIVGITRNPYYLVLLWLCIAVVNVSTQSDESTIWNSTLTLWASLAILPMSAVFNALTTHYGSRVLFVIPGNFPLVSGAVTLEALTYGLINGLVLSILINAFWTFNRCVSVQALLRLIPRAFFPLAVVASIAVTFIPLTLRQFQQIREAQSIRGHRMQGLKDFFPILMPLLIGSLERSFQLAEALTARGFHQPKTALIISLTDKGFLLFGLICFFFGWQTPLFFPGYAVQPAIANGFYLAGILLFAFPFWRAGRIQKRTRYRNESWRGLDGVVVAFLVLSLTGVGIISRIYREAMLYSPYPDFTMPVFEPIVACFLIGLCTPAFFQRNKQDDTD